MKPLPLPETSQAHRLYWCRLPHVVLGCWCQLPLITIKYRLLYAVLCVLATEKAVSSQQWRQNMMWLMGAGGITKMQFDIAALQCADRCTRWSGHQRADAHPFVCNKDQWGKSSNWAPFTVSLVPRFGSCGASQVFSPVQDPKRCCKPSLLSCVFWGVSTWCFLLVPGNSSFLFDGSISVYTYMVSLALTLPRRIHPQLHNETVRIPSYPGHSSE